MDLPQPPPLGRRQSADVDPHGGTWLEAVVATTSALRPFGASLSAIRVDAHGVARAVARVDAQIVRRQATDDDRAIVHQRIDLVDAEDVRVGAGHLAWTMERPLDADNARRWRDLDIGTLPWGVALADRLGAGSSFARSTGTFDGTIAVGTPERQVQLRIYRGRILEAVRKTVDGPTFAVVGSDAAWTGLLLSSRDDFVRRTSEGEFNAQGSSFQYLRMFKAVTAIAVAAKRMWEEADGAHG